MYIFRHFLGNHVFSNWSLNWLFSLSRSSNTHFTWRGYLKSFMLAHFFLLLKFLECILIAFPNIPYRWKDFFHFLTKNSYIEIWRSKLVMPAIDHTCWCIFYIPKNDDDTSINKKFVHYAVSVCSMFQLKI